MEFINNSHFTQTPTDFTEQYHVDYVTGYDEGFKAGQDNSDYNGAMRRLGSRPQ
jgi:hypothetical protein